MSVFSREYPHSFGEALRVCREILSANHDIVLKGLVQTEAEQLVIGAHRIATGEKLSRAGFFARLSDRLPDSSAERLLVLAGRRAEGELLQHILGSQVFLDHEYEVDSSTLIPRPETEVLVREAIAALSRPVLGIEIGLGTGVISIEILCAFPRLRMVASEISDTAIDLAKRNSAQILGVDGTSRLEVLRPGNPQEVLQPFTGLRADFLISNPPYLEPTEAEAEVIQREPRAALFPQTGDPLYFYREIAENASKLLVPKGKLFLEIAAERVEPTLRLFEKNWSAKIVPDLTGRPRVLVAEKR